MFKIPSKNDIIKAQNKGCNILNKIVLLNSAKYQKAIIAFDVDSIQIVGKNNIGKTSLISVLNFLYMPNKKDWNFDDPALETLKYYFKKLDKNYIIFEIYKNSYFCILMKRSDNNQLQYYKIDSSYEDIQNKLFKKQDKSNLLLDFETIQSNLIGNIEELDNNKFKTLLYGKSKRDKTVIWLNENSTQKTFSKIYKYLLNTKLITNEKLKESLLIADKKNDEIREFSPNDNQKIEDIKRHQNYISKLENIKQDFSEFKHLVDEYYAKDENLNKKYSNFNNLYNSELAKVKKDKETLEGEVQNIQSAEIEPLNKKSLYLATQTGSCKTNIASVNNNYKTKNQEIVKIQKYDPIALLKASLKNIQTEEKNLKYDISQIEREDYTKDNIQELIQEKQSQSTQIENKIKNFENLLIHHISDDENVKKVINSVFSDDILNSDKSKIIASIETIDKNILNLFDGKIDISSIKEKDFLTIDTLNTQLKRTNQELKKYKSIQISINTFDEKQTRLVNIEDELKKISSEINEIEKLPKLKEELFIFDEERKKLEDEKQKIEEEEKDIKNKIDTIKKSIEEKNKDIISYTQRLNKLQSYYMKFEDELRNLHLSFINEESSESIDSLVIDIKALKRTLYSLKNRLLSKVGAEIA